MCGIAGIRVKDRHIGNFPVDRFADYLLLGIEHRGRHATGFMSTNKDATKVVLDKAPIPAKDFVYQRKFIPDDAQTVLLHTRWFTQGDPKFNENNHPVLFDTCFAIHNGHINNDAALFTEMDLVRPAEVDSIAIPASFSYHGMGNLDDLKLTLEALEGSFATAAIDIQHPDRLILAKGKSSPLYILNHPKAIIWASEKSAIELAWGRTLGTPPTKNAKWYKQRNMAEQFKGQDRLGFYSAIQGDVFVIEGDHIDRESFSPKHETYYSRTSSWNSEDYDEFSELEWPWQHNHSNRRQIALPRAKHWTCKPTSYECEHPCEPGCRTARCLCFEGNPTHPLIEGARILNSDGSIDAVKDGKLVQEKPAPTVIDDDGVEVEVEFECAACLDWYVEGDLSDFQTDQGLVNICADCLADNDESFLKEVLSGEAALISSEILDNVERGLDDIESKLAGYQALSDQEQKEHYWACREVAHEIDASATFVDWILFKCDMDILEDDEWLSEMRREVEREYLLAKTIVRETARL